MKSFHFITNGLLLNFSFLPTVRLYPTFIVVGIESAGLTSIIFLSPVSSTILITLFKETLIVTIY